MWLIFHDDKGPVGKEPVSRERKKYNKEFEDLKLVIFYLAWIQLLLVCLNLMSKLN